MRDWGEYEIILEEQDDGGYVVSVPELPGVWTQGETRDEAIAMAKDAITGYLDTLKELDWPLRAPKRERLKIEVDATATLGQRKTADQGPRTQRLAAS